MSDAIPRRSSAGEIPLVIAPSGPLEEKHLLSRAYRNVAQPSRLTSTHYHVALANLLGWTFDGMDGAILSLVAPAIMAEFALSLSDFNNGRQLASLLGIIGVYLWPWLADRFGRRNVLAANIALFSLAVGPLALAGSWAMFIGIYVIVSIALAGEWAVGSLLVAETWPARLRGMVISVDRSGWGLGAAGAGLLMAFAVVNYGWRAAYAIPAVLALLAIYVRFMCPESPYWVRTQDRKNKIKDALAQGQAVSEQELEWGRKAEKIGIGQLFIRDIRRNTILATFMAVMASLEFNTVGAWMPLYLAQERGWNTSEYGVYYIWWGLFGTLGYWLAGWIIDRFGRTPGFIVMTLESAVFITLWVFTTDRTWLWIFGLLFNFGLIGTWGIFTTYTAEMFPTRVRGVGNGFAWGVGRIATVIWPFVTVWIKESTGSFAIAFLAIPVMMVFRLIITWRFSPEVAGKELDEISV